MREHTDSTDSTDSVRGQHGQRRDAVGPRPEGDGDSAGSPGPLPPRQSVGQSAPGTDAGRPGRPAATPPARP
ncbi:hypothetical protein AB0J81_33435, partial [Streptomyces bobili]